MGFERLWPAAVLAAVVVAAFLAASWFGLWVDVPHWARGLGLLALVGGLVAAAVAAARAGWPDRRAALGRLDRDSGASHRPISSREDALANPDADPTTRALWDVHRRRLADAAARVRLRPPSPRLVDRDPFALRAGAVLALVAAAFVAGPDKAGRLAAAFDWRGEAAPVAGFRLDAWIDPPAYTGRPPVLLSAALPASRTEAAGRLDAPVNATVVVRSAGAGVVDEVASGGLKAVAPADKGAASAEPRTAPASGAVVGEHRFLLAGDGRLTVTRDGATIATYDLRAVPDLPPTIALTGEPRANARGSLTLSYKVGDDYGVASAEATFSNPVVNGKPVTGRSLVGPPKAPLALPAAPRGLGEAKSTLDLSGHPWAGAEATMVLGARDEAGNVGLSAPSMTRLPARAFAQPLARALVEQRRNLVLDPDHRDGVGEALDALMMGPDLFGTTPAVFLGLDVAKVRLAGAKSDADLLAVADLLWAMAVQIEDNGLSQTERDLRALEQRLKDAIARNAPPEEIAALTEALRRQLDRFVAELNEKGAPPGRKQGAARTVSPRDLQSMLDRLENSAKNGDAADAQRTLEALQSLLENLQSATRGQAADEAARDMDLSMDVLGGLMRNQQALRDKTFRRGRNPPAERPSPDGSAAPPPGQGAEPGEDGGGQGAENDLQGQQGALRSRLEQLRQRLRQLGLQGEGGFADAEDAMKDAQDALGRGPGGNDKAVEAQGRALQGLKKGQQGVAGQMARGEGEGGQGDNGSGQQDGSDRRPGSSTDPIGRTREGRGSEGPGLGLGPGLAARAQQVLEELRRRLGDPGRPRQDLDYLERLMRRF